MLRKILFVEILVALSILSIRVMVVMDLHASCGPEKRYTFDPQLKVRRTAFCTRISPCQECSKIKAICEATEMVVDKKTHVLFESRANHEKIGYVGQAVYQYGRNTGNGVTFTFSILEGTTWLEDGTVTKNWLYGTTARDMVRKCASAFDSERRKWPLLNGYSEIAGL